MDILEWIRTNRPGNVKKLEDRIEIAHDTGDYSTIWLNPGDLKRDGLQKLDNMYNKYDGMDLFSSTFKVASLDTPKSKNRVVILQNLNQIATSLESLHPEFPEKTISFMYQAGIGFYAIGVETGKIYEWDEEENELSGVYESVKEIFDEWFLAINDSKGR